MGKVLRSAFVVALALGVGVSASADSPNLVTNGSFEEPVISGQSFKTYQSGENLGGWTVGGKGVDLIRDYWESADGNQSLDLNALNPGSVMQQILGTEAGQVYELSFWMAGNPVRGPLVKTMDVVLTLDASKGNEWWNKIVSHESFDTNRNGSPTSQTDMGWVQIKHTFRATSTQTALAFISTTIAQDGGDGQNSRCGPALDGVSVTLANSDIVTIQPTPEASSMLLLLPGLLPLGLMLRKRAKA
jgi:choice-of-anchor C domain-containing protein